MGDGSLPAKVKRTSALRRVPPLEIVRYRAERGNEGDVCAFELAIDAAPFMIESAIGRTMAIAPGDTFLATPGYRQSTKWVDGTVPADGLVPGEDYWVLADSGVVGELIGSSPTDVGHLASVRYLGAVCGNCGETLNMRQFAVEGSRDADRATPLYVLLGTSGDSGKTTAGVAVLRALRAKGRKAVVCLKATGTSSVAELAIYQDFGAEHTFDCADFGLPTTYPSGREGISGIFADMLDICLSQSAQALVVECGGDLFGANVPEFLACLKARHADLKIILAASDVLGAMGAKQVLADCGLKISMITGPCTDTSTMRERVAGMCGVPAINLAHRLGQGT
ncbi:MAG TPA: hypothetical protein VMU81_28405 [Acetobacteraceae bacterium]|nr:hypothetical protein [Acetobacteraceae bacterium]